MHGLVGLTLTQVHLQTSVTTHIPQHRAFVIIEK